jgi:pyruvate,water dikinase
MSVKTRPERAPLACPSTPIGRPSLIVPLTAARRADVPRVGGKGANLGEMTAAGLPVPPGFIISIEAYRQFYESNELGLRVAAELATLEPDDPASLEHSAGVLEQLVLTATVPDTVRLEIERAYDALVELERPGRRVAVRSSATAEDTARFTFAGMFESYLNVLGKPALIDKVKACWASTFGARVLFYRIEQGLPAEMPVAVIVQRMINAEKSGVIYTADPATRDPSRMVIEAVWGLGEAVVQGAVTPDRHVVDKRTLGVIATEIAEKELLLAWDGAKRETIRIDLAGAARAKESVLTAAELQALATLALRAEAHCGAPQVLEFAIELGHIYLTQSRSDTLERTRRIVASAERRLLLDLARASLP